MECPQLCAPAAKRVRCCHFRTATSWRAPRAQDVKKLKEAGHQTVGSVNMECKKKLTQVRGLSEAKVEKILEAAAKISVRIAHCPLS